MWIFFTKISAFLQLSAGLSSFLKYGGDWQWISLSGKLRQTLPLKRHWLYYFIECLISNKVLRSASPWCFRCKNWRWPRRNNLLEKHIKKRFKSLLTARLSSLAFNRPWFGLPENIYSTSHIQFTCVYFSICTYVFFCTVFCTLNNSCCFF